MTTQNDGRNDSTDRVVGSTTLRQRAEEKARATGDQDLEALPPEEARRLLHELRVHQIELEMQNEELRRAQEELEASRARYFDLYDLAPVGYVLLGEPGLILEANLTAANLLGVARSAMSRQPLTRFILPEDQDIYYRHRKQLFETGQPQVCEMRMVRQGGSPFWARLRATAVRNVPQGQDNESGASPVACRIVISDITQLRQAEEARQRLADDLKERVKELDCLYGISALIEQPGISLEGILQGAVRLLPPAWRFPEVTCARLLFEDWEFRSENYRETEWRLTADLAVHGRQSGCVEVCYLEPRPWGEDGPFLAQEQKLLVAVAQRLGRAIERIQIEEELRSQRQLLELIIDNIPAYIVYTDSNLTYRHVNRAYAEWFGRSKEEVVGKNVKEVAGPGAYQELARYVQQVAAGRQAVSWEAEVASAAGQTYFMRRDYIPHLDEQGNVQGFVALLLDVTEQRRAEEELRSQRQLLDLILDNMPAYIAYADVDLNILHVNRALAEWWGYSKEQVVGKNFKEVAPPAESEYLTPYLRQVVASRQTVTVELRGRNAAGRAIVAQVNFVPLPDEQGNVQGLVVLTLDVTEQRRAEEALRASEERYRLVVENMQEGVAIVDDSERLIYVNDRLCEMTGRTRDELMGERSAELFFGVAQEQHLDQLARRRAGFSDTYESVLAHVGGAKVPVLITASPLGDPQGKYKGSSAVVADITVQKRVEQALIQAKEAAEAARASAESARFQEQGRRQEADRRRRLAEGLADVLAALNAKRSLDDVLNLVARRARQLLAAQAVAIYAVEGPGGTPSVHATQGSIGALFSETSSLAIRAVLQEAIAQRRPVASAELSTDTDRSLDVNGQTDLASQAEGHDSFLAAPILLEDLVYGALVVYHSRPRSITIEDKEMSALMAAQAALAVENTRLRAEAEEAAIATERTRLARELHDAVTQALFSASLISETLPVVWERYPNEGRRALDELRRLTHGALAEMRTLLLELRPASLVAQPLDALIAQLADSMSARTRTPVVATVAGDCTTPEDVKIAMYRIAQEALNNVVKHARANQVRIDLRGKPDCLTLSVHDDGQGFDPARVESRQMGLGIMRERANAVGAHLSVESRPGQGTTITVSWSRA
jgi:PAS domain S-box-containing protein